MTWRDQLRPASFRGVPFGVEAASGEFGRRVQLHEYPQRDLPYSEDLGRKIRELRITAFVVGDDVFQRRDRLIKACEEMGEGTLEHPTLGRLTVVCTGCSLSESRDSGGSAQLELSFSEAGTLTFPAQAGDGRTLTRNRADATQDVIGAVFGQRYGVHGLPDFVSDAAAETLRGATTLARTVTRAVFGDVFGSMASTILDTLPGLVADSGALSTAVFNLIGAIPGASGSDEDAAVSLSRLGSFGFDLPRVPETTPARRQQAEDQRAIGDLVRRAAAIEAARVSAGQSFDSYQSAVTARDDLADRLDDEMLIAGDQGEDDAFAALSDLRAAVVADLSERSRRLARVRALVLPESRPALVVAYDLYEDATRDSEIARRNRLAHEGLVPPGVVLEVLTA